MQVVGLMTPIITLSANVTLSGPNTNWGADQMIVSFSQIVDCSAISASYGGTLTLDSNLSDLEMRDQGNGNLTSWYTDPDFSAAHMIIKNSRTAVQTISNTDWVKTLAQAFYTEGAAFASTAPPIESLEKTDSFTDYVSPAF